MNSPTISSALLASFIAIALVLLVSIGLLFEKRASHGEIVGMLIGLIGVAALMPGQRLETSARGWLANFGMVFGLGLANHENLTDVKAIELRHRNVVLWRGLTFDFSRIR
jgi:Na+/proline symporter